MFPGAPRSERRDFAHLPVLSSLLPKPGLALLAWLPLMGAVAAQSTAFEPEFGVLPGVGPLQIGSLAPVLALTTFDAGSGPRLIAAGRFTGAGGMHAKYIAQWDGVDWAPLGVGLEGEARALEVYQGPGDSAPALYVGGLFQGAGAVTAKRVARWDGAVWSAVGAGFDSGVYALHAHTDSSGTALIAGGAFFLSGSQPVGRIARFVGGQWQPVGIGISHTVRSLATFDDGQGAALMVGTDDSIGVGVGFDPVGNLATFRDGIWSAPLGGPNAAVLALEVFADPAGPRLYLGGVFTQCGSVPTPYIASFDGQQFATLGAGMDGPVTGLSLETGPGGQRLLAVGGFKSVDGSPSENQALWDGQTWTTSSAALGDGFLNAAVAFTPPGASQSLRVVGGRFDRVGAVGASSIAAFDGANWNLMVSNPGLGSAVQSSGLWNSPSGPRLVFAGKLKSAGGQPFDTAVVSWDGGQFAPLGASYSPSTPGNGYGIRRLIGYDDGAGEALFALGKFDVLGGQAGPHAARFDGSNWQSLGLGLDGEARAALVFDAGQGAELYIGGRFQSAGGLASPWLARWTAAGWQPASVSPPAEVTALCVHDAGNGPRLHAAVFLPTGGSQVLRLEGPQWVPLGGTKFNAVINSLVSFDDGQGAQLFAGGSVATSPSFPYPKRGLARIGENSYTGPLDQLLGTGLPGGNNWNVVGLEVVTPPGGAAPQLLIALHEPVVAGLVPAQPAQSSQLVAYDGLHFRFISSGANSVLNTLLSAPDLPSGEPAAYVGGDFSAAYPSGDAYLSKWVVSANQNPYISQHFGCRPKDARLYPSSLSAEIGQPFVLRAGSSALNGVAYTYIGADGAGPQGCGLYFPEFGELLLTEPLLLLDSSPIEPHGSEHFGSSDCSFFVPSIAGLVGKAVPLQVLLLSVQGQDLKVELTEQLKLIVRP